MRRLMVLAVLLLVGCPKGKHKPDEPVTDEITAGGFVDLGEDTDADLDDLMGSELMRATAQCGDLVQLEPSAMMGTLNDGEIRCLDEQLRNAERQTIRDKISRVLMNDAWAKGDRNRWETIARRHLEDIDRSDPNLCYKFSKHLVTSRGPEHSDEVQHWADIALENRSYWEGDTYVRNVYSLYKIKALASQKKWQWKEEEYLKAPSEEANEARIEARNELKTNAREWLEYARSAGKDPTIALQLCISAAGTEEFCQ